MKKIFNTLICVSAALAMTSCDDFFTREPINEFSAETYFSSEAELKMYTTGMLNSWIPDYSETNGNDAYNDLIATKTSTEFFRGDVEWDATKQGSWTWTWLRRINYMLEGMEKNAKGKVSDEVYNHYEGLARFWRAYHYISRVKLFSNVPWVEKVLQPTDTDILYGDREDREYVMHMVAEDLKFACAHVNNNNFSADGKSRNQLNGYVINAMASRMFLYEGTYRKNHAVNPATNQPWNNKYETADDFIQMAADCAKSVIDSKAYSLHNDYASLFLSDASSFCSDEVMWAQIYLLESNGRHSYTRYFNSSTLGQQYSGTKELIHHYLNLDGTPIATDQVSITNEFTGRDKRLAATVLGPGHKVADLTGVPVDQSINCTFCWTGYMLIKWCVPDMSHWQNGIDENAIPIIRYAEVLLNYAEAMNELGKFNNEVWDLTIGALRKRAGVTSIYPTASDPWLKDYYTRGITNTHITDGNEAVALEIRRERVTELCFEAESRQNDLFRWGICEIIPRRHNGQGWAGLWLSEDEVNNGFTFAGIKYTINEKVNKATETGYPITGTNNSCWSLEKAGAGYYLVYNYALKWEDKMYVRPIPTEARTINPNITESYGW